MAGQPKFRRLIAASTTVACLFAIYAESSEAQRRRSRASGLFQTLMSSRVEKELKLTDTQKKQISDLSKKSQFGRDQYSPFVARIEAAKTDAEKDKIRAEMKEAAEKHRDAVDEQAKKLLTEAQRTRVQQLRYRFARSGGLLMTSAIAELKITDEQKEKIEAARKELTNAYYKINRRDRYKPEVMAKFYAEWNPKLQAALTPDQRSQWQKMLGDPPSWEKAAASSTTGGGNGSSKSATTGSSSIRRPATTVPAGSYTASFDAKKAGSTSSDVEPKTNYGAGTTNAAPKKRNPKEKQNISFTFNNAPWKIVIEQFAKKAGLRLDADEVPAGTFSYNDSSTYTPTRALDLINGYLLAKKFILIRRGKFLVVHNLEKPVPQNIVPDVKVEDLPYRGNNELLRVTFNLDPLADIKQAKLEVEELLNVATNPQNKVIAITTASMLIVTGIGSELTKVAKVLEKVSVPADKQELSFKAFQLVHISAGDAETILKQQLNAQQTVRNVSRGGQSSGNDRRAQFMQMMMSRRSGRSSRGSSRFGGGSTGSSSRTSGDASVRVTSDDRTNNVLVLAPMSKVSMAEKIVKAIDVPLSEDQRNTYDSRRNVPYLKVYKVSQVNSTEVTKTLTALMPEGSVINEDGYNHTIHIWGNDELQEIAKELIGKMDSGGEGGVTLDTVPVRNLDPVAVANSLSQMFINERNNPPMIQADVRGRQLLVKASKSQIDTIRSFVAKLEANAKPVNSVADIRNNFLRLPVTGDPNQFAATLQKVWNSGNKKSFLNVIRSPDQSPIRARMDSSGRRISPGFRPDAERNGRGFTPPNRDTNTKQAPPKRTTTDHRRNRRPMSIGEYYAMHTPAFDKNTSRNKTFPTAAPAGSENSKTSATQTDANGKPQITVTVQNGQLIIYSKDKQALVQINQMASQLQEFMPNKQTWTVIYLQAADATETATMLGNLFPASSVTETADSTSMFGSMTSGIRSFGNTLMDMSGTSLGNVDQLKIIPEIRSNALFISGSYSKVQDVKEVLRVLDATDIPSGARDRLPRMIPVRYANVNDVAQNIRDLFGPEMQAQRGGSSRGNPLAMLMGGGRGGRGSSRGGSRQQPQVKLTLGVDERTGHILVSCDDTVFQRVEQLVYDLDKTAYEANRTTRVIQLQHATPSVISQTLTAMYPNVSVTVSGGTNNSRDRNNNSRNSQNNSNSNDNSRSDAERNARRAMFMQMMQQRGGQNGGRSSSPFGSRSGRSSRGFDFGRGSSGFGRGGSGRSFGGFGRGGGRRR